MNIPEIDNIVKGIVNSIYPQNILQSTEDITLLDNVLDYEYDGKTHFLDYINKSNDVYSEENLRSLFDNFKVIKTVGDGTCFIHSFLTCTSETYRKIPYDNRDPVGQKFRKEIFHDMVKTIKVDKRDTKNLSFPNQQTKEETLAFIKSDRFLEDRHINIFLEIFNVVNVMFFVHILPSYRGTNNPSNEIQFTTINKNLPTIIVYNAYPIHYMAVLVNDKFILEPSEVGTYTDLFGTTNATTQCPYNIGEEVFYNNKKYIVDERVFDKNQNCIALNLKEIGSNTIIKNVNISDVCTENPNSPNTQQSPIVPQSTQQSIQLPIIIPESTPQSTPKCKHKDNDEVIYNNRKYIVVDRILDKNQTCIQLKLKDASQNINNCKKETITVNISQLGGKRNSKRITTRIIRRGRRYKNKSRKLKKRNAK